MAWVMVQRAETDSFYREAGARTCPLGCLSSTLSGCESVLVLKPFVQCICIGIKGLR